MEDFFILENLIGQGTFASVFLSKKRDEFRIPDEPSKFAIKIISMQNQLSTNISESLFLLQNQNCSKIVKCYYSFLSTDNSTLWTVMEYCPWTLTSYVKNKRLKRSFGKLKELFIGCAESIKYLHEKNIIHRDIKPDNILLDKDGNVKQCDFNVMKTLKDFNAMASTQVGTPLYSAPEVYTGQYNKSADIWSQCATFYEILKGFPPYYYQGITDANYLADRKQDPKNYEKIEEINCNDEAFRELLNFCLVNSFEKRPNIVQVIQYIQNDIVIDSNPRNSNRSESGKFNTSRFSYSENIEFYNPLDEYRKFLDQSELHLMNNTKISSENKCNSFENDFEMNKIHDQLNNFVQPDSRYTEFSLNGSSKKDYTETFFEQQNSLSPEVSYKKPKKNVLYKKEHDSFNFLNGYFEKEQDKPASLERKQESIDRYQSFIDINSLKTPDSSYCKIYEAKQKYSKISRNSESLKRKTNAVSFRSCQDLKQEFPRSSRLLIENVGKSQESFFVQNINNNQSNKDFHNSKNDDKYPTKSPQKKLENFVRSKKKSHSMSSPKLSAVKNQNINSEKRSSVNSKRKFNSRSVFSKKLSLPKKKISKPQIESFCNSDKYNSLKIIKESEIDYCNLWANFKKNDFKKITDKNYNSENYTAYYKTRDFNISLENNNLFKDHSKLKKFGKELDEIPGYKRSEPIFSQYKSDQKPSSNIKKMLTKINKGCYKKILKNENLNKKADKSQISNTKEKYNTNNNSYREETTKNNSYREETTKNNSYREKTINDSKSITTINKTKNLNEKSFSSNYQTVKMFGYYKFSTPRVRNLQTNFASISKKNDDLPSSGVNNDQLSKVTVDNLKTNIKKCLGNTKKTTNVQTNLLNRYENVKKRRLDFNNKDTNKTTNKYKPQGKIATKPKKVDNSPKKFDNSPKSQILSHSSLSQKVRRRDYKRKKNIENQVRASTSEFETNSRHNMKNIVQRLDFIVSRKDNNFQSDIYYASSFNKKIDLNKKSNKQEFNLYNSICDIQTAISKKQENDYEMKNTMFYEQSNHNCSEKQFMKKETGQFVSNQENCQVEFQKNNELITDLFDKQNLGQNDQIELSFSQDNQYSEDNFDDKFGIEKDMFEFGDPENIYKNKNETSYVNDREMRKRLRSEIKIIEELDLQ